MKHINSQTKIFCIFGHPVGHSLSPAMHNYAFEKAHLNYVYLAFDVTDIKKAVDSFKLLNFLGASITIPHKIEIMKYLDEIDPLAKKIGACNTVINENGKLIGYNTDWYGAILPIKKIFNNLKGKKVVLLGAGGAARAIAFGLAQEKAKFIILNRTLIKAADLAKQSGAFSYDSLTHFDKYKDSDIIINSTSVGLENKNEDMTPINTDLLSKSQVVFDIVYKPKITKLLKEAQKKSCRIIHGYNMLLYQAELQYKLFTNKIFPTKEVEKILIKNLF